MSKLKNTRPIFVCLIGTDGSGKTTTTNALFEKSKSFNRSVSVVWCGSESYIMRPIRLLLKRIRGADKSSYISDVNYRNEIRQKYDAVQKYKFLIPAYVALVMLDYKIQYWWKMRVSRKSEIVLLDRYFFDVAVNLALTLSWDTDELIVFIQNNISNFRLPDVRAFIHVAPEISMARKDDIPDIAYVELRLQYYKEIARVFDFAAYDGTALLEDNTNQILTTIDRVMGMRHVHYVHSNNEDIGGADYCLHRMAVEVNKTNRYRSSVSLRLRSGIENNYSDSRIPVFIGRFCRPQLSRGLLSIGLFPFKALFAVFYFYRLLKVQKPDLVHLNDLYDFLPAISAKLVGIPVVYHIRMIRIHWLEIKVFSFLLRYLSDVSFSVSEAVKNTYFDDATLLGDHIPVVVPDWPSPDVVTQTFDRITPSEFENFDATVLMVGRVEWWKGQHVYLEAIELIRNKFSNVGFFLVGGTVEGKDKERYANMIIGKARSLGVIYLGQRSDVPRLLSSCDISVHCSVTPDPFPGVVLESLLAGAATVGVNSGGVKEMIRHKQDGLLYESGDAYELSECLSTLLSDKVVRENFSSSARDRILKLTDRESIVNKICKLYDGCVK